MKVLYVVEGPAPYGSNKSLIDLIDYVRSRGVEPVVVGSRNGPLTEWLRSRGIPYYALMHRFSIYPRRSTLARRIFFIPITLAFRTLNLIALIRLVGISRKLKPDIIHTNVGPVAIGSIAARILRIKHVWHLREYQDLDFGMKFFPSKEAFKRGLRNSDRVICVSHSVAAHFGNPKNARVIHNGVADRDAHALLMPKEKYFLFAGRLEAAKGIEQVLMAYMEYVTKSPVALRLMVVGDGKTDYMARLLSLTKSIPAGGSIQFLGFRDDVTALMQRAKALIVASENEGFGRITAEAMFSGCLVIGRNSGGTAEILEADRPQSLGLLFDSHDALVSRLIEATIMSDGNYVNLVSTAQTRALDAYCVEQYGSQVLDIYGLLTQPPIDHVNEPPQ